MTPPIIDPVTNTNPIENKVFDVSLLLEKIVADFADFKGDVKSKVREKLKVSSIFGTSYQFADWIWGILDEYGFRSVERIINFFEREDMQENLAKVILNDDSEGAANLQCKLNMDTPFTNNNNCYDPEGQMSYPDVARVGILVFAQHIHDTFIGTSGWKADTWNWLMNRIGWDGYTLVDLVDNALGAIGDAVEKVKDAKDYVVNAVEKGLEWISDNVLGPIIDEFVTGFQLILKTVGYLLDAIINIPELSVTILSDGIQLNDKTFRIYLQNLDAILEINTFKVKLNGLFVFPTVTRNIVPRS